MLGIYSIENLPSLATIAESRQVIETRCATCRVPSRIVLLPASQVDSAQGLDILFTLISTSHLLIFAGSNRTQLPTRKLGIVPRFARRRIVNLETFKISASSSAVMAL